MSPFWLLLLPIAAGAGWLTATKHTFLSEDTDKPAAFLPQDYLKGLNYLLNEEPDKALDVFIKMVEVDSETIETHLALGNLFRRRGEVERATRIHQNLIARPHLSKPYRMQALFALSNDYFSAGMLDRAERLFLELVEQGAYVNKSLDRLLDIYQQEKAWKSAIEIAQKMRTDMRIPMAHYYCELAEEAIKNEQITEAVRCLKKALSMDRNCVRSSLILAGIEMKLGHYKQAIRSLKQIYFQNPDFFSEAILPLAEAYRELGKEKEMAIYLRSVLERFPKMPIAILLSERIRQWKGDKVAADFVGDYVRKHPSIVGLHHLVKMYLPITEEEKAKKDLRILFSLTEKLIAKAPLYQCVYCGFSCKTLHWQCPGCKHWGSTKPTYALQEE